MTTTHYLWDEENDSYFMETDGDGNVTAVYTNEPVPYGRVISQRRGNATSFYHYDGQGSTRQLTDENGNVTDEYTYSAFGETAARSGATVNPFGYKGVLGYYTNSATGNIDVRERIYHPTICRWLSHDPADFLDGTNQYHYCRNNPVANVDPSGRITVTRKSQPPPTKMQCGSRVQAFWSFELDRPAPCIGWIVQMVTAQCEIRDCNTSRCPVQDPFFSGVGEIIRFLEVWPVAQGATRSHIEKDHTDQAGPMPAIDGTCGFAMQSGYIKFICDRDMRQQPTVPWRFHQKYGTGRCTFNTGILLSTPIWPTPGGGAPPPWWPDHPLILPDERNASRLLQLEWSCCPCQKVFVHPHVSP